MSNYSHHQLSDFLLFKWLLFAICFSCLKEIAFFIRIWPEGDGGNGERPLYASRPTVLAKVVQAGAPQHGVGVGVDAVRQPRCIRLQPTTDTKARGCT